MRSRNSEVGIRKWEVGSESSEVGSRKWEVGMRNSESGIGKSELRMRNLGMSSGCELWVAGCVLSIQHLGW